ncbi:MAG: HD family hydrolase [Anaerolineae bacterium]|nr:MAG: HD family hydrolase [Anaerolineae bacterium]
MTDPSIVIQLLLHGNRLKQTPRTGWAIRGVPAPESVADHSYGVAYTAMALAQIIDEQIVLGKLLALALLHDLPEGISSDIPAPSWDYFLPGIKETVEDSIMDEILGEGSYTTLLKELWKEWVLGESAEAKLVDDADKLDRFLQALVYENQTGNRTLGGFWKKPYKFHYPQSQAIYEELKSRRPLL